MEELRIEKPKQRKLTIYDQEYMINLPTVGEIEEMVLKSEKADGPDAAYKLSKDYLVSKGIPSEVLMSLTTSSMKLVSDFILGVDVKKK